MVKHAPSVVCSFFTESKFTWKHASATTFHKILLSTKTNAFLKFQDCTGLCILFYLCVAKYSLTLLRVQWSLETRHSATSSFRLKLVVEPLVPGHALMDTLFKIENSRWRITYSNKVKSYHEFSLFNMVILLPINFYPNPTMKVPLQLLLLQAYYSVTSSEHRVKK